ncbi:MAG: GNAT family N-acetyltransferase [Promethearchaeota archaeon]
MEVKNVVSEDLKKLMALEKDIFKENAFSKELMEKLMRTNTLFLKLVNEKIKNNVIGFIIVIRDRKDRANLINFLIDPKFQDKGFGTFLLRNAIERLQRLNEIKKIILNVQVSNSKAIKLYEKFNFKKNPIELRNYYQSGESSFLMELNIDSL